jgi:hypothetical protein
VAVRAPPGIDGPSCSPARTARRWPARPTPPPRSWPRAWPSSARP